MKWSTSSLTPDEHVRAAILLAEYLARPQHASRMTPRLLGSLSAAANRVAKHGNPPGYRARAAYRMHKKRRAKLAAAATYGNPLRPDSVDPVPAPSRPPR